jgi:hypothetical protein
MRCPVQSVTFERGSKLREICRWAFTSCDSLKSICLPASVEKLDGWSFADCGLSEIFVQQGSKFLKTFGEFLMDAKGHKIVRYFGSSSIVTIPHMFEVLGRHCFYKCRSIREVRFASHSRLRVMKGGAFDQCDQLRLVAIPSQVASIGKECFQMCSALAAISFSSNANLTHIKSEAFYESGLESIVIPLSVEHLGSSCFSECSKLTTITFPAGSKIVEISDRLFEGCSSLATICLPLSVEKVTFRAFWKCEAMTQLVFPVPCRIRTIRDLPPNLAGWVDIPDSVETLVFSPDPVYHPEYALRFGRESRLIEVRTRATRSFLQTSSRSLKSARANLEFHARPRYREISDRYFAPLED